VVKINPRGETFKQKMGPASRDGHGKFESKDDVYEGNWKQNVKEGYGTSKYASGGRYQGQWKMGMEEGNGKRLYPDGCVCLIACMVDCTVSLGLSGATDLNLTFFISQCAVLFTKVSGRKGSDTAKGSARCHQRSCIR
jgi:hypothetical protein